MGERAVLWIIKCCVFFFFSFSLKAQEEQQIIKRIENASSRERVLALSIYYEENTYSMPNRTPGKLDHLFAECYRMAERDGDREFKEYLDFYKRLKPIIFVRSSEIDTLVSKQLKIWEKELEYYQRTGDKRFIAICEANIGLIYFTLKRNGEGFECILKANELFKEVGYDKFPMMGRYLHDMALIYYYFREFENVVELMKVSVRLPPHEVNKDIQRYYTLGAAYEQLQVLPEAEKAFAKAVETATLYYNQEWIGIASRSLADVYLKSGKYTEALELYKSTLKYTHEDHTDKGHCEHLLGIAKAYIFLNDLTNAGEYLHRINYKVTANTKENFESGKEFQDMNYLLNYYEVKTAYYQALKNYDKAYLYTDSLYALKYNMDSSFDRQQKQVAQYRIEIKNKQHENAQKEAVIKSKNQQVLLIAGLLAVIGLGSVALFRKNQEISRKNKVINEQLAELSQTLNQKRVLLSELQHRVKNNLQHVISILEIQKESVDFNNIDELIRGNQNRIHSMALLYKKLNVSESVNNVDLKRYVTELSELVRESYDSHKKKINLNIRCDIETLSVDKALPVGLIIVELVSNSMKHAFYKRGIGIITIEIIPNQGSKKLYYSDNGIGFNFNSPSKKGLGQEIIKGLIDQLDGTTQTKNENGFELTVWFK